MRIGHPTRSVSVLVAAPFALVGLLCNAFDARAEGPVGADAAAVVPGSISVGTPMEGSLRSGSALPRKGQGFAVAKVTVERRARFGVAELVSLIEDVAAKVMRRQDGPPLAVADLSLRKGGDMGHHGSHENGRDVDLIFYARDRAGKRVFNDEFVPYDVNGHSTEPPLAYQFDTERNWALVEALITSKKADVQWIFVSERIAKLLLDYAAQHGARPWVTARARQILNQPGKKAHVDHFHVRILCPTEDLPACRDVGPRWVRSR